MISRTTLKLGMGDMVTGRGGRKSGSGKKQPGYRVFYDRASSYGNQAAADKG
jgi:hypothetical protein